MGLIDFYFSRNVLFYGSWVATKMLMFNQMFGRIISNEYVSGGWNDQSENRKVSYDRNIFAIGCKWGIFHRSDFRYFRYNFAAWLPSGELPKGKMPMLRSALTFHSRGILDLGSCVHGWLLDHGYQSVTHSVPSFVCNIRMIRAMAKTSKPLFVA